MRNVRNLMRNLCILVLFLSITNCQHDTLIETQQEETLQNKFSLKSSVLSMREAEANTKLSTKMRSLATLQTSTIAESVYNDTYNFTIDTYVVKLVENTENDAHSYTFPISRENNVSSILENLVFSYNATIDDYDASLVTYHFTASQKQEFLTSKHVSTPYDVTNVPIAVNLADILGETVTPCTTNYTEYHTTPDSGQTFVHSSSIGNVNNDCEHEDSSGNTSCTVYTIITTDCAVSGSSGSSTGSPSSGPTGGNNNSTDTTPPTDDDEVNNVITSPISREESIKQSITDCINGVAQFNTIDTTTIDVEILEQLGYTINDWITINDYLTDNDCSEVAQQEVIDELIEEAIKKGIVPPSCEAFDYSNVTTNWQASATMNIIALIGYYDVATGEFNTASIIFPQPIYFEMPINSVANGGYISNGRAAELTAKALFVAIRRAKVYFLATNATSSQVQAKLWEYIREEMTNGTYVIGGRASFTPPLGYNGVISNYESYWFIEDDCD